MQELRDTLKLFVSHSWNDKDVVEDLYDRLSGLFSVWTDNRELRAGDPIAETIERALDGMDVLILVWSKNSANPKCAVHHEIAAALARKKRIIPCVLGYDAQGNPDPQLPEALRGLFAIDFRHPLRGTSELLEYLVHFRDEKLPESVRPDAEDVQGLGTLRRFLQYSGDRERREGGYNRDSWTDRATNAMVSMVRSRPELAATLLEAARQNEGGDPAFARLRERLEATANEAPGRPRPDLSRLAAPRPAPRTAPPLRSPLPEDDLTRRVAGLVGPAAAAQAAGLVRRYLEAAPNVLQAMIALAQGAGSRAGMQVVSALHAYLVNPQDLIPDHLGEYGFLDDAWLIHNTAFRLIESGLASAEELPLPWEVMRHGDHIVHALLPGPVSATLEAIIQQFLVTIATEVQGYQPWFTPDGAGGYSPTVAPPASGGGCWEDRMNEALLGTGLSV